MSEKRIKVKVTRACFFEEQGRIYRQGDTLEVSGERFEQLGHVLERVEEPKPKKKAAPKKKAPKKVKTGDAEA